MASESERNFQSSLNAFASGRGATGTGGGGSNTSGGGIGSFFGAGAGSASGGGDGPLASLMGTVRSTTQNVASSLGLSSSGPPQQDEYCGLTYFQRMIGFVVTFGLAAFCFMVAFFSLPLLLISPTKFATTFSLGS
ncbi:hypothetical protein HK405_012186, partial [Cladochytrium tenue]